jgi:hypothetical protein
MRGAAGSEVHGFRHVRAQPQSGSRVRTSVPYGTYACVFHNVPSPSRCRMRSSRSPGRS